jgi:hypothetical protein
LLEGEKREWEGEKGGSRKAGIKRGGGEKRLDP